MIKPLPARGIAKAFEATDVLPDKIWAYLSLRGGGWGPYCVNGTPVNQQDSKYAPLTPAQWLDIGYTHWSPYEEVTHLKHPLEPLLPYPTKKATTIPTTSDTMQTIANLQRHILTRDKILETQKSELATVRELLAKAEKELKYWIGETKRLEASMLPPTAAEVLMAQSDAHNMRLAVKDLNRVIERKDMQIRTLTSDVLSLQVTISRLTKDNKILLHHFRQLS